MSEKTQLEKLHARRRFSTALLYIIPSVGVAGLIALAILAYANIYTGTPSVICVVCVVAGTAAGTWSTAMQRQTQFDKIAAHDTQNTPAT